MSFLQKPLYLSSLTVLLNLPPSAVLPQQAALQQIAVQHTAQQQTATQRPALQRDASHGDIGTDRLCAVQIAVQRAVAGECVYTVL